MSSGGSREPERWPKITAALDDIQGEYTNHAEVRTTGDHQGLSKSKDSSRDLGFQAQLGDPPRGPYIEIHDECVPPREEIF